MAFVFFAFCVNAETAADLTSRLWGGFITSAAALAGRPPEADLVGREIGGDGGVFEHVR